MKIQQPSALASPPRKELGNLRRVQRSAHERRVLNRVITGEVRSIGGLDGLRPDKARETPISVSGRLVSLKGSRTTRATGSAVSARPHQKPFSVNLHFVGRVALDIQQVNGPLTLTWKGSAMRRVKPPSYVRSWQNPAYADKYKKLSEPVKKEKTRGSKLAGAPRAYVNNPNKVSVWKRPTTDAAFARRKRSFC